jgi:hypothetical protein
MSTEGASYCNEFEGNGMWKCGMGTVHERIQGCTIECAIMNLQVHKKSTAELLRNIQHHGVIAQQQ